jgi:hypothetical protein
MGCEGMKRLLLSLLSAVLAVLFAGITPPGESPDELAHLRYAEKLATGHLPSLREGGGGDVGGVGDIGDIGDIGDAYETHQPPLGYVLPALVLAASGGVEITPVANPRLDFHQPGSRAFLPPFAPPRDLRIFRLARMTQALWAALAVWAGLARAGDSRAALPYLLAPQLLFVCGALNNDAALVAISSCALLLLVRFVETGKHATASALLVSAALFTKGSALFLLVPVGVAALLGPPEGTERSARLSSRLALLGVTAAGLAAWVAFNLARFGAVLPPVPTASHVATVRELLTEPRWVGGLFRSFWAKFGWLNTPMPWPFYLWFLALTAAAGWGAIRRRDPVRSVLVSAVLANVGLVLSFMLSIDKQPQGRYLLPSLAAIAALGCASPLRRLARGLPFAALVVAASALATVALAFR